MYAIYFRDGAGERRFVAAVDDAHSALSMAKFLSREDPRDVVVVENRVMGDTVLVATFRRGVGEAELFETEQFEIEPAPMQRPVRADGAGKRV